MFIFKKNTKTGRTHILLASGLQAGNFERFCALLRRNRVPWQPVKRPLQILPGHWRHDEALPTGYFV